MVKDSLLIEKFGILSTLDSLWLKIPDPDFFLRSPLTSHRPTTPKSTGYSN